ncbi:1-aminocyclopropane-1-carboxylate oxidase homolog 1-like [Actinidia eriantha]|uniref:1-aminocyclopropane-1-carboxylate oxidase homolog 1-like n=1 Tax=Actinidia eriantha TaxID=165200 RepID=UPI00258A8C59|nr:1-aminocyclopropane-1-carboxylate oxidase homolog 1-like [Actinidia eriantha]
MIINNRKGYSKILINSTLLLHAPSATLEEKMDILGTNEYSAQSAEDCYDRAKEPKSFDDSKAGVKGLIDAGVTKIPKIFIRPPDELSQELKSLHKNLQVPVIDLGGIGKGNRHEEIVREVQAASEKLGFFQVVNHGIPSGVLDKMIDGGRAFHEQDPEVKKAFYRQDHTRRVKYESKYDLLTWRDSLIISMGFSDHIDDDDEIPSACRTIAIEYMKHVTNLGDTLFELLSEALGLKPDHLTALQCNKGRHFICFYYPACPETELTLGIYNHSDATFLTILLQDQLGGFQVIHENQWVDVQPIAGALLVNIGDLLQMVSNNKFKSVNHRVLAKRVGPRISVGCFCVGGLVPPKLYGPIKELISEENPPLYRDFLVSDYIKQYLSKEHGTSVLDYFKL